jgi:diguanylate cyclase (GGDEF)-like protein/PAS domain S-box-containing protein
MLKRVTAAPLHIKLLGGFALVLAISAAQSSFTYWTALANIASDGSVADTQEVLSVASDAHTALLEMERDYLAFLLSGDGALLESYTTGVQTFTVDLTSLERLTADNPPQVARWRQLEQDVAAWQDDVVAPGVSMRQATVTRAGSSADEVLSTGQRSFALAHISDLDRIRIRDTDRIFGAAIAVEQDLLDQRLKVNDGLDDRLVQALTGGSLLVLGVGALVAILFARGLARALRQVGVGAADLRASVRRYRQMFENNQAIKLLIDPTAGTVVEANAAACTFYGYSPDELHGRQMSDLNTLPTNEIRTLLDRVVQGETSHFEAQHRLAGGEVRDVEVYSSPLGDFNAPHGRGLLFSIIHDITDRKQATEALRHQAQHDALTGLPNRIVLQDRLQQAILQSEREGTSVALLLLDLDRFKEINDTFGHQYGDRLVQQIGPRLGSILRASDVVARLGGDEFAVLLTGVDTAAAAALAQQLLQLLNEPFMLEEHQVEVGASIGIAASPVHGTDAENLLRRADVAMYVAKSTRSGLAVYSVDQDHHSAERLALLGELRQAINGDQLVLHYQPKVDFAGKLTGVEALVRWQHPRRGLVQPDAFIELAEHAGLIKPLTRWVLDAALRQCRHWMDAGHRVPVAVNFSTQDLQDEDLPDALARLLAARGVPAALLRVEITEGAIMSEPARALAILGRLRQQGVGVSIDDFGTGYSSLAYLKRLPVDELKIDRSFVRNLATDEEDVAIVRSTIGLAHELGLQVIAEGVEDEATWCLLERFGCDLVQGYFVGRPVMATDIERWFDEPMQPPRPHSAAAA